MTGEAEHEQVVFRVVTALEDPDQVMDVELALRAWCAAGLTPTTTHRDQSAATRRGELGGTGSAVVGLAQALAKRWLGKKWRESPRSSRRARAAEHAQVGGGGRPSLVQPEEVEEPGPLQSTGFARSPTPAVDRRPGSGIHPECVGCRGGLPVEHAFRLPLSVVDGRGIWSSEAVPLGAG